MPTPAYLVKYNNYTLPGFAQRESFDSVTNIADHYAAYVDGSLSEDLGLANKQLTVGMKVWEQDYMTCKDQVQLAATMVRSTKAFAPLYVGYTDKHYMAMGKSVTTEKDAGTSVRTLDYEVQFECKPWLQSDTTHVLHYGAVTDPVTITTDVVGRTIANGGWTPTTLYISGENITVSGYTSTGEFTGFISISGQVAQYGIFSEDFVAINASGVNVITEIMPVDFRLYVGPGKTSFYITGAVWARLEYNDRWYI
jgi:hypothetical protein